VILIWSVGVASEFVEEVYDAELNQVYDILVDVAPRPVPGTEVVMDTAFIDFVFSLYYVISTYHV